MKTIQCAHPPHYRNGFVATCRLWTASGGFKFSSESCKNATEEIYQDVNESFCIVRSSFLISIFANY